MTRRRFLQITAAAAISGNALLSCSRPGGKSWRSLAPEEAALVNAISGQVIPTDQDPGGKEAGLVNFIDLQLAGPYRRFRKTYSAGLAKVDQTSELLYQSSFVDLPLDKQTTLLARLETNTAPKSIWQYQSSSDFFWLICDHCMQAYYGSPRHGGNLDCASWKMLRINYPQICGRRRRE